MRRVLALGAALTLASIVHAGGGYLRPGLAYFDPAHSGASGTVGVSLAAGYAFGSQVQHEFEIELGWAAWERDETAVDDGNATYRGHSENSVVPVLLNYRFTGAFSEKVRGYLECGLGCAPATADWEIRWDQESIGRGSDSDAGVAASIGAGFLWRLGERRSLRLGIRRLIVVSALNDYGDYPITEISFAATTIDAGYRIEF